MKHYDIFHIIFCLKHGSWVHVRLALRSMFKSKNKKIIYTRVNRTFTIYVKGKGKERGPTRDSSPGSLAYRVRTLTTELPSHMVRPLQYPPSKLDLSPNLLGTMTEPTRQSLCRSQPEHGLTLSYQMSQARRNNVARPGLESRVSRLSCEHSNH